MAKLSHPNVVTVYGADTDGDEIYLAMELVDGVTLRQWLTSSRTLATLPGPRTRFRASSCRRWNDALAQRSSRCRR